jgi:peptide/nickel transport system substrate-binding protein
MIKAKGAARAGWGIVVLVLLAAACSPGAPAQGPGSANDTPPRTSKVMRVGVAKEPEGFVMSMIANPSRSGGGNQAQSFASNMLQNFDEKGNNYPEMAAALPSTADGTWKINPDGTTETLWRLRQNMKWHDGTPITAEDLLFGFGLMTTPGLPNTGGTYLRNIDEIVKYDDYSVLLKWRTIYVDAIEPGDNLPILPKHLLERPLATLPPEAILNLPYWTTEYVGAGPFKLSEWLPGVQLDLVAFDDYYRGRPKLDRILFRIVPDANTQIANVLAGELDLTLPTGIDVEGAVAVQERGGPTQVLLGSSGRLRNAAHQAREEYVQPKGLLDPRTRQALFRSLDRSALSEATSSGRAPPADSIVPPYYDIIRDLESSIPPYPYDVPQAQRELQELGWTRGNDGSLRDAQGEQFRLVINGGQSGRIEREMNAMAIGWKELGIQVEFFVFTQATAGDNEARSPYPGLEIGGSRFDEVLTTRKSCRTIPTAANSWRGNNRSGYCNQEFESLIDRLSATIDPTQRLDVTRSAVRFVSTDFPIFPMYWEVEPMLAAANVRNVHPPTQPRQLYTFNSWEWDRL